jgi:TolA-binding protein/predicted Ser/Thr protein kinase
MRQSAKERIAARTIVHLRSTADAADTYTATFMTGQTVTHYRVGEKLGEGGSGVVYRAEDLALSREVVLKFFSREGAAGVAPFLHEARTISSLNHPNICTIYEIGEHEGRHFLAMEMLDGQVLSRAIGGRPLKIDRVIDFGTQMADALDAAHTERIVHRDLKPANIFVTRSGRIKLLDFGVAVLLPRRADPTTPSLSRSSSAGTIPYMSPEQTRAEELDHRTDLFSLGTVLYEMATGSRPFAGPTAADVRAAILSQPPQPPSTLNPAVPSELDRIISKAQEKDPALRYQTASDLRADLQRLKRDLDRAIGAGPRAIQKPEVTRAMRSSVWLRIGAMGGLSLIAGIGWLAVARSRSGAAAPGELITGAVQGADIVLPSDIAPAPSPGRSNAARPAPSAPTPQKPVPQPHSDTNAASVTAPPPAVDPRPSASIDQLLVGRQQIALKLYDQAIQSLQKVADGPDRRQAIDAAFLIASVHDTRGDVANAMGAYVEIANRFPEDPRAAEALLRLAESTLKAKRRDGEQEAARTLTQVVATYPASSEAPRALLMRGDIEARQARYQRDDVLGGSVPIAAVTYRELIDRYASSDAATEAFNRLARIYVDAKRFEIAALTFQMLAARDAANRYDAWFAAAELFDKRLNDKARARAAYSRVPPSSSHYAEAQKRLARKL